MIQFRDLKVGDTFDCVSPDMTMNSFYRKCVKLSARTYKVIDSDIKLRVGSINAYVWHVNEE